MAADSKGVAQRPRDLTGRSVARPCGIETAGSASGDSLARPWAPFRATGARSGLCSVAAPWFCTEVGGMLRNPSVHGVQVLLQEQELLLLQTRSARARAQVRSTSVSIFRTLALVERDSRPLEQADFGVFLRRLWLPVRGSRLQGWKRRTGRALDGYSGTKNVHFAHPAGAFPLD